MVTGASKGIGFELAKQLNQYGARLILVARSIEDNLLDPEHVYIRTDLTTAKEIARLRSATDGLTASI